MINKKLCIFNWSGGKDSTLALHYALQDDSIDIKYLITTVTEQFNRVSMHGIRDSLLVKQAASIGIPLIQIRLPEMPDMETYDKTMSGYLLKFKEEGITHSIFGDIFLEDLRKYRESKLAEVGLEAIFPLWNRNTNLLIDDFLKLDYKTVIVCAQQNLKSICGKVISRELINQLPADIDPCGENGEFHTFAFEGPIFKKKVNFEFGEMVFRTYKDPDKDAKNENITDLKGFWYIDLLD